MDNEIQSGKYWNIFKDNFNKYFDLVCTKNILELSKMPIEEFFANPHILLYGNDPTILKLMISTMIERVFKVENKMKSSVFEVDNNNNKYSCPYKHCQTYIAIDMAEIATAEKQFISDFIYKHISQTKNIYQQKHIIVMYNVNTLSTQSAYAMRRPLEVFSNNVMFIFTSKSLSNVEPAILSRFMMLRCNIAENSKIALLEKFAEDNRIEHDIELDPDDSLVFTLLKMSNPNTVNTIENSIKNFLINLFKEKQFLKACEMIRVFVYKILHFNVPVSSIMKIVIYHVKDDKKFKTKIYEVVSLSANLEVKASHVSKVSILMEQYFMHVYRLASTK